MGKDKVSKASASNSTPSPPVEEKKQGRGHKQRGAGTVITAKPPVVTNDGVVLKAHERLPCQILHEYCQREKRPVPKYNRVSPPGIRLKVVLEDPKNSKNDLSFCPVQSFESESIAKDYAALLALFHVQKSFSLERKLPEPYCTAWLDMVKGGVSSNTSTPLVSDQVSIKTSKVGTEVAKQLVESNSTTKSGSKSGVVISNAPITSASDWLCDNCGIANFHTLANGSIRTKCFRCQNPKPTIVSGGLKGNLSIDGDVISKKSAPKVVSDLRSDSKFISKAEEETIKIQQRAEKNRKLTYFDALKRANRPQSIHIPVELRSKLEELFKIVGYNNLKNDFEECIAQVEEEGIFPNDIISISAKDQAEAVRLCCQKLLSEGTSELDILVGLKEFLSNTEDVIEDFVLRSNNALSSSEDSSILASVIEENLRVQVLRKGESIAAGNLVEQSLGNSQVNLPALNSKQREALYILSLCGWNETLSRVAIEAATKILSSADNFIDEGDDRCLAINIAHCILITAASPDLFNFVAEILSCFIKPDSEGFDLIQLQEEKEAMFAILGDSFAYQSFDFPTGLNISTLTATNIVLSSKKYNLQLDLLVTNKCNYPDTRPLVMVRTDIKQEPLLVDLNVGLFKKLSSLKGGGLFFELVSFLNNFPGDSLRFSKYKNVSRIDVERVVMMLMQQSSARITENSSLFAKESFEIYSEIVTETETDSMSLSLTENTQNKTGDKDSNSHPFWKRMQNRRDQSRAEFDVYPERKTLPAWAMREQFLEDLASNQAMVVTGETGCGKTTQIPQFIHDTNSEAKVLICQPRRLAATGVAMRVAEEQGCSLGDRVGYMVKGDSKVTARTRIVFCTYGVLLRRLQDDPTLEALDYIILDEIHERGIDSDFCLALLMDALARRPALKLILMSATISTDQFRNYLLKQLNLSSGVPILSIPGFTFPVIEFFKGQFEEAARAFPLDLLDNDDEDSPWARKRSLTNPKQKDIDYDLLVRLVFSLIKGFVGDASLTDKDNDMWQVAEGCILIFLPGVPEINKTLDFIRKYWREDSSSPRLNLISLHGNVPPNEQKKVFQVASRGMIKIVAATNVAEASITIPDVTVVIDTCKVKEMEYDPISQAYSLVTKIAAKDSLRQRKGRAGRVRKGRCYRLITYSVHDRQAAQSIPEILRLPLDNIVLQTLAMCCKSCNSSTSKDYGLMSDKLLSMCPDPPSHDAVVSARKELVCLQAITPDNCSLTPLGLYLSRLPCVPRVGRLLIFGSLLSCTLPAACVAAAISCKSPFLSSSEPGVNQGVNAAKESFSKGLAGSINSDYFIIVQAIIQFQAAKDRRKFCKANFLSFDRMIEINQSVRDLIEDLCEIGLVTSLSDGVNLNHVALNGNSQKSSLLSAVFCAGLYPQVAKIMRPPKRFMEVMGAALEKDAQAKDIKLYIPLATTKDLETDGNDIIEWDVTTPSGSARFDIATTNLQRVFIHPSSTNFSNSLFKTSNYILYGEKQISTNQYDGKTTSKVLLRDTSEVTSIALLIFGGSLSYNSEMGLIAVDEWIRFACTERMATLIQEIRKEFSRILECKIADPLIDISQTPVIKIVSELLNLVEY